MFIHNQFITYSDVYYALLYFILTDKLILSEFRTLSFCEGFSSCFSYIIQYISCIYGAGISLHPRSYLNKTVSYDISNRLQIISSLPYDINQHGHLRRAFIILCTMDYIGLCLIEDWKNYTLFNVDNIIDSLYNFSSNEDGNNIYVNVYRLFTTEPRKGHVQYFY